MNQFCPILLSVQQICFDLKKKERKIQAHGETDIGSNCAASQCQLNQMLFPIKSDDCVLNAVLALPRCSSV